MSTSFEEAFDFDLNFLQQPNQNVIDKKLEKQRKAVLIAKKKTIATDSLIKKYYVKKETLEQTELMLLTAKEECKRVCIDYKNTLEKCTGLEKDIQTLKDNYGLLEAQYTLSQNRYEAITSHANQLQSLVKENELKIESLQIEKQLGEKKKEKDSNDVPDKSLQSLKKKNETLLKHILILKDIVLGKKILQKHHKILLRKYKKAKQETNDDDCHDGNYSSDETEFFEECLPPILDGPFEKPIENKDSQTETYSIFKENNNDLSRTNGINGVQEFENDSEDTGRGSSLAFTDGGKFFNSPDYYEQDSPHIEVDETKISNNRTFTDASTSPAYNVVEKATSPLIFEDVALLTDVPLTSSSEFIITDIPVSSDIVTTKEKLKLVDCSTSPICDVQRIHVACSPIRFTDSDLLNDDNEGSSPHIEVEESIVSTKKTFTDASTSPAYSVDEKATSPLIFEDMALLTEVPLTSSSEFIITDIPVSSDIVTTKEKLKSVDCSTSSICDVERIHVACSPIRSIDNDLLNNNKYKIRSPHIEVEGSIVSTKKIFTDASTSPAYSVDEKATSPLIFEDVALLTDVSLTSSSECIITDIPVSSDIVTTKEKLKLVDCSTSPTCDVERIHVACSPIRFIDSDLLNNDNNEGISFNNNKNEGHRSPRKSISNVKFVGQKQNYERNKINREASLVADLSQHCIQEISCTDLSHTELEICDKNELEKICLEKHNSYNLIDKGNNDSEIEMILSSMRLDHRLLTPIPISPSKSREKTRNKATNLSPKHHPNENYIVCLEAVKLREENKVLAESIANLSKELTSIKSLQEKNLLINMTLLNSINNKGENCESINKGRFNRLCTERNMVENLDEIIYTDNAKPQNQTSKENSLCDVDATLNTVNHSINLLSTVNKDVYLADKANKDVNLLEKVNEDVDFVNSDENLLDTVNEDVNLLSTVNDDENLPLSHFIPKEIAKTNDGASLMFGHGDSNVRSVNSGDDYVIIESFDSKIKTPKRKLTKLQKLRHKMLPKYKIPENKFKNKAISRKNIQPIVVIRNKAEIDKITDRNNKLAFEKAIKIMTEVQSKENKKDNSQRKILRKQLKITKDHKNQSSTITNLQINEENDNLVSVKNNNIKHVINEEKLDEAIHKPVESRRKSFKKVEETKHKRIDSKRKSIEKVEETKQIPVDSKRKSIEKFEDIKQKAFDNIRKSIENEESTMETSRENPLSLVKSNMRATRSRSKLFNSETSPVLSPSKPNTNCTSTINNQQADKILTNNTFDGIEKSPGSRKGFKRPSNEVPETVCKRILRSSKIKESVCEGISNNIKGTSNEIITTSNYNIITEMDVDKKNMDNQNKRDTNETNSMQAVEYSDLDMFSTAEKYYQSDQNNRQSELYNYPNSILCKTIDTYKIKTKTSCSNKKPEQVSNAICKKLEEDIGSIIELPADKQKQGMNKLVEDLQKFHVKSFISGFMKYLKQPARKLELFKTVNAPPAPSMTNAEQILLYVIKQARFDNQSITKLVLENIEFTLFQLNRTPEFDVVESMSHFYAITCKYFGLKNRLRMFLLDAMYCLSFKVTAVVKQCLNVWMHILPLAHMGIAKNPLVTCLVYLLHFYKCEDRFKRVQDIRYILQHKFFYRITEWNDTKIIEMFKNAIKEIRDIPVEKKILRMALIILGKRQGPTWCDKNIINNMLLPIITKEKVSNSSKEFAVSMLGPLLKPFPVHMKLSCEMVVNQLLDMLDKNPADSMKEAIFTSLIYMSKHNQHRVTQALLIWEPLQISDNFKKHLKNYVREKSPRTWTKLIPELLNKYQLSDNGVY